MGDVLAPCSTSSSATRLRKRSSSRRGGRDFLTAIDPKTGKIAWRHSLYGGSGGGILTTAGGLISNRRRQRQLRRVRCRERRPLWHMRLGTISNAPQTYRVDGRQHVLVAAGDPLYSFKLY